MRRVSETRCGGPGDRLGPNAATREQTGTAKLRMRGLETRTISACAPRAIS